MLTQAAVLSNFIAECFQRQDALHHGVGVEDEAVLDLGEEGIDPPERHDVSLHQAHVAFAAAGGDEKNGPDVAVLDDLIFAVLHVHGVAREGVLNAVQLGARRGQVLAQLHVVVEERLEGRFHVRGALVDLVDHGEEREAFGIVGLVGVPLQERAGAFVVEDNLVNEGQGRCVALKQLIAHFVVENSKALQMVIDGRPGVQLGELDDQGEFGNSRPNPH